MAAQIQCGYTIVAREHNGSRIYWDYPISFHNQVIMRQSIAKNFVYNAALMVANVLFPLLAFTHASRIIGPENLGMVNFASTVTGYFSLIGLFGMTTYGVREIARVREEKERLKTTFNELFLINVITVGVALAAFYLFVVKRASSPEYYKLYSINSISLILSLFSFDWLFQGLENYKYITVRSILVKTVSTVLILLLVKSKTDYLIFALLNIAGLSLNNLFNLYYANKVVGISFCRIRITRHFPTIIRFAVIMTITSIYLGMDKFLLGLISGEYYVGIYVPAEKITRISLGLIVSFATVVFPRLSNIFSQGNEQKANSLISSLLHITVLLSLPLFVAIELLAPDLILMFSGAEYIPAILTLRIEAGIILLVTLSQITGVLILVGNGEEGKYLFSILGSTLAFALCGMLLIPEYKQNGAAVSLVVAEAIGLGIQLGFCRKRLAGTLSWRWLVPVFVASCGLGISITPVVRADLSSTITILFSTILGVIVYFSVLLFLGDSIVVRIKKILADKIKAVLGRGSTGDGA